MRGKIPYSTLLGTILAVCLFSHSAMAAKTVRKDVCVSSFGMNWQTSADAQAFLLATAKRQAVGELFGEVIRSITQVRNFQLTRDDIEAASAGFIRVQGSPEYYKGQGLGEVCVKLTAYVTDADVARFAPRPVQKKVCIGDPRLSLGEIRKTAERQARIQAVRDVEPGLEHIGDEVVLGLMHEGRTESGGFLPDTTVYCTTVSGTVYPIELLTVREGYTGQRSRNPQTLTNSIGMEFVLIPAGEFWMGNTVDAVEEVKRWLRTNLPAWMLEKRWGLIEKSLESEMPRHRVRISQPYYLGRYEVTQGQWQAVMGNNPSQFRGNPGRPVERVSWYDIQKFIGKLNAREGRALYRLPTEAEWEYAARAGSTAVYSFGDDSSQLGRYAWYGAYDGHGGNSDGKTHTAGQLQPNAWGLYDMHGNVWEWVQDWWMDSYPSKPVTDPQGPPSGTRRVARGGGWWADADGCRSARRNNWPPDTRRFADFGFRLLRIAP